MQIKIVVCLVIISCMDITSLWARDLPRLHVDGKFLKTQKGEIFWPRGVAIPDPEHLNSKKHERSDISASSLIQKAVRDFGVSIIRITVLPESDGHTGFFRDKNAYFEKYLLPVIDLCERLGVYAIVDLHYVNNFIDKKNQAFAFWDFVAPKLKDRHHVFFELFNEATGPDDVNLWEQKFVTPLVAKIRRLGANNILIIGSPNWNTHIDWISHSSITDKNIMYSIHIYPNEWKLLKRQAFYRRMAASFPLFLTEWGYDSQSRDTKLRGTTKNYGIPLMKMAQKYQIPWTAWCFDSLWEPRFFSRDWSLRAGKQRMGEFVQSILVKKKPLE